MPGYVVCGCCGCKIPATFADIGRAVVCPTTRRLVMVRAGDVHETPEPAPGFRAGPWIVGGLAVLVLSAVGGYFAWNHFNPKPAETADNAERKPPPNPWPPGEDRFPPEQPVLPELAPPPRLVGRTPGNTVVIVPPVTPTTPPVIQPMPPVVTPPVSRPEVAIAPPPRLVVRGQPDPGPMVTRPPVSPDPGTPNPTPTPSVARPDANGLATHRLLKRIDLRTPEELQKGLLGVREVALDTPPYQTTSQGLYDLGISLRQKGGVYPGPMYAARSRADLAGLPFHMGAGAALFKENAENLSVLSKQLREVVQNCIPAGNTDPRPDPAKLFAALLGKGEGLALTKRWATAEAVPCIQQMLQADGTAVRRMSVELLRQIDSAAATDALVRWAVCDLDAANRAAAVDALKARDRATVTALLLKWMRHPWPRAAEHAAEALVALECKSAVPDLAAMLVLPDPDAPVSIDKNGKATLFRREMVRVNHAHNCLMCHPPSGSTTDLVRAAIPDPARPLASPITPSYYTGGSKFATASTTYLRQDFSVNQPVPNPGQWPDQQRYDYMIAVRPMRDGEVAATATGLSDHKKAILFALRELNGKDLGTTADAWTVVRAGRTIEDRQISLEANRYLALWTNPEALLLFNLQEFGPSFMSLTEQERQVVLCRFRHLYGNATTRYALIAYLEGLVQTGDPAIRADALRLLALVRGTADFTAFDPAVAARMASNRNARVRAAGVGALASLGKAGKPYYKDLLAALKDADAAVRESAALALGTLETLPDDGLLALAAATIDGNARVRLIAAESLVKLGWLPTTAAKSLAEGFVKKAEWDSAEQRAAFEKACLALIEEMKGKATPGYLTILRAAVGDDPTQVPATTLVRAIKALGPPPKQYLPKLVQLLARKDYRVIAETHLMAAGDDAVPPLITGLQDESAKVRLGAAEVLGKAATINRSTRTSWRAALDALATAKSADTSPEVRAAAAAAITKLSASR